MAMASRARPAFPRLRPSSASRPLSRPALQSRPIFTRSWRPPLPTASRTAFALKAAALVVAGTGACLYLSDSRAGFHRWVSIPLLHFLTRDDPELAHRIAIQALKLNASAGFIKDTLPDADALAIDIWGRHLSNPLGLAAGFDKHAEAIDALFDLGFGYVEVGSVTPVPQPGNPTPRVFRLPSAEALVNRYGFNSEGHHAVLARLRSRLCAFVHHHALALPSHVFAPISSAAQADASPSALSGSSSDPINALLSTDAGQHAQVTDGLGIPRSLREGKLLSINLGKNKTSAPDSVDDFVDGVRNLGPYADVLVINVSSPNTPGLRGLQRRSMLEELLEEVVRERDCLECQVKPPVLVKIAPDLDADALRDVGEAALACRVDGIIVSNTTIQRPECCAIESAVNEAGGLSGPPLKPLALRALSTLYATTSGQIPLIGCGGIRSASDALEFAAAGASMVQLYTALVYEGVGLPRKIKTDLERELERRGKTWREVVGSKAMKGENVEGLSPRAPGVKDFGPAGADEAFAEAVRSVREELEDISARLAAWKSDSGASQVQSKGSVPAGGVPGPETTLDAPKPSGPTEGMAGKAEKEERGLLNEWKRKRDVDGPRRV